MKKTYMTPAISVMAMETAAILAGSTGVKTTVIDGRPFCDVDANDDERLTNQLSKDYTFEDWED